MAPDVLTDTEQAVRLAVYRGFLERGHAPLADEIAAELGAPAGVVHATLRRLHELRALVVRPSDSRVMVAHPFSTLPTPFAVDSARGPYWGYCVWDSLAIAALVPGQARIRTRSGADGSEMTLMVGADGALSHPDARVHFSVPAAHWWDDISFACGTILLFDAADSIDEWCRRHGFPRGEDISAATAWALARDWYGDRLSSDWRRRTPSEARSVLRTLGLTSDFWNLPG